MGLKAQMGLKGDVYARDILHATATKIALGKESPQLLMCNEFMKMKLFPWKERGECTCLPLPMVVAERQKVV